MEEQQFLLFLQSQWPVVVYSPPTVTSPHACASFTSHLLVHSHCLRVCSGLENSDASAYTASFLARHLQLNLHPHRHTLLSHSRALIHT